MCGLVGHFYQSPLADTQDSEFILRRMSAEISSRGPDELGIWKDESIGLAHRRLAVLDLSTAGHQPMHSSCGRYVLTFNGEIYNHTCLRSELNSSHALHVWRGHSDTETFLECFSQWGIKATLERCNGMFAFALWDRKDHSLTLGRDRMGEKPLYYGWQGSGRHKCFLFGSELKALKVHPSFQVEIDRNSLALFMRYKYIPAPYSIYKGIFKLKPGTFLTISQDQTKPKIETYWSTSRVALEGVRNPFVGSDSQAIDELEHLLKSSVSQQMVADVPLGSLFSGGVDSSLILALMQAHSSRPVNSFTIGFHEEGYNESVPAKVVADYLGTDHSEMYVSPKDAIDVIPLLPKLYCEPFADPSQIPTFLVSQLARNQVTVCLSGDAGDELFAGYNRYLFAHNSWKTISRLPLSVRSKAASILSSIPPRYLDRGFGILESSFLNNSSQSCVGEKLHKVANILDSNSVYELYSRLVSTWEIDDLVLGSHPIPTALSQDSLI